MDITGYVEHLRADLVAAAATGGEAMVDAAERLATSLDAAVRMALLEALSDAAAEITAALDGATVEVRLRGRDPDLVVTDERRARRAVRPGAPPHPRRPSRRDGDDDASSPASRCGIPEPLKQRAEVGRGGDAAVAQHLARRRRPRRGRRRAAGRPPAATGAARKHLSGWAR